MKNCLALLLFLLPLIAQGQPVNTPKENFHLYLLAGQSNMAGRGKVEDQDKVENPKVLMLTKDLEWVPAVSPMHFDKSIAGVGPGRSFGLEMSKANPDVVIGLIPCAAGGSPISTWAPGGFHNQTKSHPWDDAVKRTQHAQIHGILKGILWHQGESDSNADDAEVYEKKLHRLIERFRTVFQSPELPFIAAQIGRFEGAKWSKEKEQVNRAYENLPNRVKNTAFISAEKLGHKGDKIHFNSAASRELGKRYAAAMIRLLSISKINKPNILFAIADDWSFGHAGSYGTQWVQTPAFDSIAQRGLLFNRAYTPNAKCAPSRAIILTGRYSWQLESAANHMNIFPSKFGGYQERLEENGYFTGYTGKGWGPGIANDANGKRRNITGKPFQSKKAKAPAKSISNNDYAGNFKDFLDACPEDQPWSFWFGTTEPHRGYEKGVGRRLGKNPADIKKVPTFWPDNDEVRNDMLDYAVEVEHYDTHLGRILQHIEDVGQLDNTLVVATSDHGMPFPRCKGQAHDYSNHVPLAIMWPKGIKGKNRVIEDYVSFADFAPTFLEVAGLCAGNSMQPITGWSLMDIFKSTGSGQMIPDRDHVLVGKERHDVGRPNNWGYPIRGIVHNNFLYLHNYEPTRWPIGNPETGYLNCDASPTKSLLINQRRNGNAKFWNFNFGKRPEEELYNLTCDPDCVKNLANDSAQKEKLQKLRTKMEEGLRKQNDPRMSGKGHIFEEYPFIGNWNNFYEKYMKGEKMRTGWVIDSDYEPKPLD